MAGFIRLHRQITSSEIWGMDPEFSRLQAWIDLLMMARWKPGGTTTKHGWVDLDRGQLVASERFLEVRWSWSRGKIRRFLKWLESRQQIVPVKNGANTVITILNYDEYQSDDTSNSTNDGTSNEPVTNQQRTKEKKGKKGKKVNNPSLNGGIDVLKEWSKVRTAVERHQDGDPPGFAAAMENLHPASKRIVEFVTIDRIVADFNTADGARMREFKFCKDLEKAQ